MSRETKNEVYEFIVKCTFEFCSNQLLKCDSSYLSKRLNISRSLASQYLNEFYRDGIFLKVQTRPVYFLDRHTLESVYQIKLENNEFYDEKELLLNTRQTVCQSSFTGNAAWARPSSHA